MRPCLSQYNDRQPTLNNVTLFEGSTADANETVITAKDPTAEQHNLCADPSGTLRVVQKCKNVTADLAVDGDHCGS